jgi:hypothetical protein
MKTSTELKIIQEYLTKKLLIAVKQYEFKTVAELAKELDIIDRKRRKAWHKEKFGVYEDIANDTLRIMKGEKTFEADDIPF